MDMFRTQSCARKGVTPIPGVTKTHVHANLTTAMCVRAHTHTHTQAALHPLMFTQTQGHKDLANTPQHMHTHTDGDAKLWAGVQHREQVQLGGANPLQDGHKSKRR